MRTGRPQLDYALLGLLAGKPASGYDLRRIFRDTPLGLYSDSPGSIYPALRRLQSRRLVVSRLEEGGRRRRIFALTPRGRAAMLAWLREPLTLEQVVRDNGEAELRLAFLSAHTPPAGVRTFLRRWAGLLEARRRSIAAAREALAGRLSLSSRLALDLGYTVVEARAAWCRRAVRTKARS